MDQRWAKYIVVGLLLVIVGAPFVLRLRAVEEGDSFSPAESLIIFTPHNEQIRYEFARAFNEWRKSQNLPPVGFDWRTSGGASDLRKQVLAQFQGLAEQRREDQGVGADLFWGGGEYEHNQLARGVTVTRDGQKVQIPATLPVELPEGLLEEALPQQFLGSDRLYRDDLRWVGVVLASFGIVYNRDVLDRIGVPEPQTWSDLTDPKYAGWVALADPGHSGSIAQAYNVILRRSGWTEGWSMLRRVFANARYFTSSASKVPVDVSAGEAAAGMCIDFYGRFQAGAISSGGGGDRVGYVDPENMTSTGADPISILVGAPHRETANQFVVWLLSAEAQRLWQRRLGTPGGPARFELRRQPIRRDLFTPEEKAHWADPELDPFHSTPPLPKGTPDFYGLVSVVSHAMAIDVHEDLVAAWRAILATPADHPRRAEMLRLFDAMPPELTLTWPDEELTANWRAILDGPEDHPRREEVVATLTGFVQHLTSNYTRGDAGIEARLRWTLFFRDNYRRIVAMAAE